MDPADAEHLIHAYVQGWRTGDRAKILGTLAPDCMIIGVWIFWGESKALFLHLTNRCREN